MDARLRHSARPLRRLIDDDARPAGVSGGGDAGLRADGRVMRASAVKRRAAGIAAIDENLGQRPRSLRHSSMQRAQQLLDYTTKHYSATDGGTPRCCAGG